MTEKKKTNITDLITEMKNFQKETIWDINGQTPEDDLYQTFEQEVCPYHICDGSGFIKAKKGVKTISTNCQCHMDEVLKRKLVSSKMEEKYWSADFNITGIDISLLKPKKTVEERKFKGKKPASPPPEDPMEYINRTYDVMEIKKGVSYFSKEFTKKTLSFLNETPRKRVQNLLLMGEPGRGKTLIASAIGKEYLKSGKSVHFTTMMNLVSDVLNPEVNIKRVVESVDLLIVDEMGYEYHTETQWALKQIKELFRIRYNKNLPIISTTNYYPSELNELYDKSLMSILNGTFFFILAERDNDYRLEEIDEALEQFTFLDEE